MLYSFLYREMGPLTQALVSLEGTPSAALSPPAGRLGRASGDPSQRCLVWQRPCILVTDQTGPRDGPKKDEEEVAAAKGARGRDCPIMAPLITRLHLPPHLPAAARVGILLPMPPNPPPLAARPPRSYLLSCSSSFARRELLMLPKLRAVLLLRARICLFVRLFVHAQVCACAPQPFMSSLPPLRNRVRVERSLSLRFWRRGAPLLPFPGTYRARLQVTLQPAGIPDPADSGCLLASFLFRLCSIARAL